MRLHSFVLYFLYTALLFSVFLPQHGVAAQKPVTITLPEETIASSIKAILPFQIDTRKIPVKGKMTIVDIDNLQITNGGISCKLKLSGQNMALSTNIGGHQLNLDVGSLQLDVNAYTTLHFNSAKQILYIKPAIKETKSSGNGKAAQIGPTLIALLNGQQFPIALQPLQPIVMQTGNKQVVIKTRIVDVSAQKDKLQLHLLPAISTYNGI